MSMDLEHIGMLHAEAIEQLDLMYTTLEAAEQSSDTMRDSLDDMSVNHWDAYMDVIQKTWLQYRKIDSFKISSFII